MYTSGRYLVQFDPYTKRHYIKNIANRHSDRQWQATQKSIEFVLELIKQKQFMYQTQVGLLNYILRLPERKTRQKVRAIEL